MYVHVHVHVVGGTQIYMYQQIRHAHLVSLEALPALHILEAELADVDHWQLGELMGVRGEVPGLDLIAPQLHHADVLHPRDDILVGGGTHAPSVHAAGLRGRPGTAFR